MKMEGARSNSILIDTHCTHLHFAHFTHTHTHTHYTYTHTPHTTHCPHPFTILPHTYITFLYTLPHYTHTFAHDRPPHAAPARNNADRRWTGRIKRRKKAGGGREVKEDGRW